MKKISWPNQFDEFILKLTKREVECLFYVLRGKTAVHIGRALDISTKTAESYIASAKVKLGCKNKSDLFDFAFRTGVIIFHQDLMFDKPIIRG